MKHMKRGLTSIIISVIIISLVTGCRRGPVDARLDLADSLMESRPDSALTILDSISAADLSGNAQKARHALLLSMALDKNYVDTTTFDILQPAIDYYPRHGSPDEKLRTYYYQGRIYQNAHLYDEALRAYYDGLEAEHDRLEEILHSDRGLPDEVKHAIKERVNILNTLFANEITAHDEFSKSFEEATSKLLSDSEVFMNTTRLAFKASHPLFIKYFEDHGLTEAEINYVCTQ